MIGTVQNMITESTGPDIASRIEWETPKISITDLTWYMKKAATYDYITKVEAPESSLRGIPSYSEVQVISRNFNSDTYSFIFNTGAGVAL